MAMIDHTTADQITAAQRERSDELKLIAIRGFKWYKMLADGSSFEDEEIHELMRHWSVDEIKTFISIGRSVTKGDLS